MTLPDLARLGALLLRLRARPRRGGSRYVCESSSTEAGCPIDVYAPAGRGRGRALAVHGLTVEGGRDYRLVHFARTLARSGTTCVVPTLPALADGRLHPSDVDVLDRAIAHLRATRLCLIGFSVGGTYALRVAGRDHIRRKLEAVVAFNACYDASALLRHLLDTVRRRDAGDPPDHVIYAALVLARACGDRLGEGVQARVLEAMRGYCERSLVEKQRDFREVLALLPLDAAFARLVERADCEPLTLQGHLSALDLPVSIVHDRSDELVPVEHARLAAAELARGPADARVWITRALSHVDYTGRWIVELRPMFRALAPLVHAR